MAKPKAMHRRQSVTMSKIHFKNYPLLFLNPNSYLKMLLKYFTGKHLLVSETKQSWGVATWFEQISFRVCQMPWGGLIFGGPNCDFDLKMTGCH